MSANASTGVLDPCMLRVSVRKELKGGRSFQKLGFTDLNLAEFAGSGHTQRKCLLEGYDTRRRQDNSMLSLTIRMNMLSGDILFKVPSPNAKHKAVVSGDPVPTEDVAGVERRDDFSGGSIASASSGFSSLTKKRPPLFNSELLSGEGEEAASSAAGVLECFQTPSGGVAHDEGLELGHSRNSSNTSQMSKGSGYGSLNSQHSRQSSSGDSGHIRSPSWPVWHPRLEPLPATPPSPLPTSTPKFWGSPLVRRNKTPASPLCTPKSAAPTTGGGITFRFPPWSGPSPRATSSPGLFSVPTSPSYTSIPTSPLATRIPAQELQDRNNGGSASGLVETGSLDRGKAALERRKKAAEEGSTVGGCGGTGRVEFTRVNPNSLIDQLIRSTNLDNPDDAAETSGLQLFIAKDGTTALGSQEVKNQMSTGVFKQVVIEENR
ncbi:EEIG family member 2 isoform X2 [Rhodnius prolixus]